MRFVWHAAGRVVLIAGALFAVGVVAWHFYLRDHAALTDDGVARSLSRAAPGGQEFDCRGADREWRCRGGERTLVVTRARKNCWRVREPELTGCVRFTDYVLGLMP